MASVREMLTGALRLVGVKASGETLSSDELADGVLVYNEMIDAMSAENLLIHAKTREEFTLTAGQVSRTVGPTGNLVTTRPVKIARAAILDGGIEYPVDLITQDEYANIPDKTTQSQLPHKIYVQGTFPNETLFFYPVPSSANKVVLYSNKALASTATADTDISFPPGYQKLIRHSLAKALAPEYGKAVPPEVLEGEREALKVVKRINMQTPIMDASSAVTGGRAFDFNVGE